MTDPGIIWKRAVARTLLTLILFMFICFGTLQANAQDSIAVTTDLEEPSVLKIKHVWGENGEEIHNYTGIDHISDEPIIPVKLMDMSRAIRFELELTNVPLPGTGDSVADTLPGGDQIGIAFEIKNGENWNISLVIEEDVKLYEDDMVVYLTGDGKTRGNEIKDLTFSLENNQSVVFTVEVRPLSSAPPGDKVEITVLLAESSFPVTRSGGEIYLWVKIDQEEGFSYPMFIGVGAAVLGLLFAFYLRSTVMKADRGDEKVTKISDYIHEGAMAFLNKEYRILLFFTIIVVAVLSAVAYFTEMSFLTPVTFVVGAIFSAAAGNIGMRIATAANSRTAVAVKKNMFDGLKIAFSSGAVMGLSVVSLGLLGVSIFYLLFRDPNILFGFGFGASSIALFARVGGGIYTKSADVGADLVGKVEKDIPEDDPRNPATIADNVGDNVGDVAGMGADLFESYVDSIIAAMILGLVGATVLGGDVVSGGFTGKAVLLPLMIAGIGIVCSIIGILIVNSSSKDKNPHGILNSGIFSAAILQAIGSFLLIYFWIGWDYTIALWGAMISGLVSGIVIGLITEYYTSDEFKPTRNVAESSKTGPATNIISGLSLGMFSTIVPVVMVCVALVFAYWLAGLYGIALAAVGMLSTLGITLATDSYGPVADNAAGIAEMAGMGNKVRERAEKLDAVGNTTAAIGKGFAIGSAALTALALFSTYTQAVHLSFGNLSLMDPYVITGVFTGALLVFVFSALTMNAVGKAAIEMVEEVRRQFKEIKGLMKGKAEPDYKKCVEIATGGALRQMIFPSLLAVIVPVVVGVFLGPAALGGLLGGAVVVGFLMAIMMANSGGAWDNAKKYVEGGNLGGKGSDVHKASVVGDTVGDPFKDTSGPSLNILIKLMSIVSLVFAPLFLLVH